MMCDNILHFGALTVELDSNDNITLKVGGRLPTSDERVLHDPPRRHRYLGYVRSLHTATQEEYNDKVA